MKIRISFILFLLVCSSAIDATAQQFAGSSFIRGDAKIEFRWRYGHAEFGGDQKSLFNQQEIARGTQGWYDGCSWASAYKDCNDSLLHGVNLLFRGGSPYARAVRCISDLVPVSKAGKPVTFSIPLSFRIGSEEQLSVALKVEGQGEDVAVLTVRPQKKTEIIGSQIKVVFYALNIVESGGNTPSVTVTGMLHVRVYPGLLNYGGRMTFEFYSNTKNMDVDSEMKVGSLWKDVSQTDVNVAWNKSGLTEERLESADKNHRKQLDTWNAYSREITEKLNGRGKVEISCSEIPKTYDRGEGRVQAYSGNPVKDFQYGELTGKMANMAMAVTSQMGKKFSLFRYQHNALIWNQEHPEMLDETETGYFDQWLLAAKTSANEMMLDIQISPFTKAYKSFSKMGTLPLSAEGVPKFTWEKLKIGFVTAIRHAKEVCPQLRIVQMPYEFDNIANTECHRNAHYQLFKVVYRAVNEVNKGLAPNEQIKVAGLGVNTPNGLWDFINGFLQRYTADMDASKRLDYLTWHTYLFPPSGYPNLPKGYNSKLRALFSRYKLPPDLPVIVDESGLAELSTIEDLSDLFGAARKEAAMACFTASIHDWYLKEGGNFVPISGAGWHFGLLTYGKQNVLTPYAKGMILRSRLSDGMIPSAATPIDNNGFGLYSFATKGDRKISVLVWSASPAIFYKNAKPLLYPKAEILFNELPLFLQDGKVKVTIHSSAPDQEAVKRILGSDKCQTLPLTRGADRYDIDFTSEEVKQLNAIPTETFFIAPQNKSLTVPLDVQEYGMYLITIEKENK